MKRLPPPDFMTALDARKAELRSSDVIKPDDLGLLGRVLEKHCATYGIRSEEGRGSVAQSLIGHFRSGVIAEMDLLAVLEREDRPFPQHERRRRVGP